jgi:hypothetical protein
MLTPCCAHEQWLPEGAHFVRQAEVREAPHPGHACRKPCNVLWLQAALLQIQARHLREGLQAADAATASFGSTRHSNALKFGAHADSSRHLCHLLCLKAQLRQATRPLREHHARLA